MSKTIKSLSEMAGRVYVYLADSAIGEKFLQQAEQEGFTFEDGVKPTERHYSEIMAINHNHTINYVGFIGRIAYGSGAETMGNKKLIRIDFEKYIN